MNVQRVLSSSLRYALVLGSVFILVLSPGCVTRTDGPGNGETGGNLVYVSWGDQIMIGKGDLLLDTPEKIRRCFQAWHAGYDTDTVLWRMSSVYLKRFYERRTTSDFITRYNATVDRIYSQFDPIAVARETAHRNNMRFMLYMTFLDHGAPVTELYGGTTPFPWQDRVTIEHPDLQTVDRNGTPHYGVLEMAYPEARRFMVERMRSFVEEFRADGLYVCPRTHSLPALHADQFGFSKPIVDEYANRHAINILEDPRFDCQSPSFAPDDPDVENWRRLRGEFLVQFYRELRDALPGKTIYAGIPRGSYLGPPYGNLYLDWQALVREKLVDGIVVRVYSSAGLHPKLRVPHNTIGYLCSEDDDYGFPKPEEAIADVYGPACRRAGVRCVFNAGKLTPNLQRWSQREPALGGFMLDCPRGRPGVFVEHDDQLCGNGGPFTVEAFVYINSAPGKQARHSNHPRIVSKYGHEQDALRGWEWMLLPDGRFRFRVNQVGGPEGMGGDTTLTSTTSMPLHTWIHLATTFDPQAGRARLHVNGKLDVDQAIPCRPARLNPDQILTFGAYGGTLSQVFDGKIDEFRITAVAPNTVVPPAYPCTATESHTLALHHFDSAGRGRRRFEDSAPGKRHPAIIIGPVGNAVSPSKPGFGACLDLTDGKQENLPGRTDM